MPSLYQLECHALRYASDLDVEIRRRQYVRQARAAAQRAGQSIRSVLRWRTIGAAPYRAGSLLP